LGSGFSIESTKERMHLDDKKFQKALHTLDRAGLIELLPQNRIRLKSRAPYRFNKTGGIEKTLRKEYLDLVARQIQFNPPSDSFQKTFEMYFSEGLLKKFKQDLDTLLGRYAHLARIETELDQKDKTFPVTGAFLLKPFDGWGTLLSSKK
jgi:predicted transglutaminase-like protease